MYVRVRSKEAVESVAAAALFLYNLLLGGEGGESKQADDDPNFRFFSIQF